MDDRLLALSRAREAMQAAGVVTAEQFAHMDHAAYAAVAPHFGLVSRIVADGHPDALAALWTGVSWRVVRLPAPDLHCLLYVGDEAHPIAAYDDERGMRRAWQALLVRVAPIAPYTPRGSGRRRQRISPAE